MENYQTETFRKELASKRQSLNQFFLKDFLRSPKQEFVIAVVVLWLISALLFVTIFTGTDKSQYSSNGNFIFYLFFGCATATAGRILTAYYKTKK